MALSPPVMVVTLHTEQFYIKGREYRYDLPADWNKKKPAERTKLAKGFERKAVREYYAEYGDATFTAIHSDVV